MSELNIQLSVPFAQEEPVTISVESDIEIGTILNRALNIFNSLAELPSLDILILLIDGTYQFTTPEDTIGMYSLPKNPEIIFVPKEFEIEIKPELEPNPIKLTIKNDETVQKIIERVCKQNGSIKPTEYTLTHEGITLLKALSIVEQRPKAQKLEFVDAKSEKVQLNFMELYLRGPVFLSLSDALQLSAYLLQATQGPFRCYKGSASSLSRFLPMCFHDAEHGGEELQIQWSFLTDCTREEATQKFIELVQKLPLFNCTSFSCTAMEGDESLPKEFEIIFTESRIIFLDKIKFKTRISIAYDNLISIKLHDHIEFTYTNDGKTSQNVKFETITSQSLVKKCVELADSAEAINQIDFSQDIITKEFHSLEEIQNDKSRLKMFNTDFLYKFLNMDETDERISYFEATQALAIRAESCAFHLSVLFSKVNSDNAKIFRLEITEYYIRLIAYLTYMTYDHRPFDAAYKISSYLSTLETKYEECIKVMKDVVRLIDNVTRMFATISKNQIFVTSQNAKAHVLGHLLSIIEFPFATPKEELPREYQEILKQFSTNAFAMKDLIKRYTFSVGRVEIKRDLQKTLDDVFKLHLSTITLMPLIVESSEIGELNPTLIMHQDSCNMMMTTVVEFSRLLWEDRIQLTDEQLVSFLQQAAEVARQLLADGPKYAMHVNVISEFLKIVDLNINSLSSTLRMYFYPFKVYASRFLSKFEFIPSLNSPNMKFRLVQCASILVVAQPLVLKQYVPSVIEQLNDLGRDLYRLFIHDFASFDLLPTEINDPNNAILRSLIVEKISNELTFDDINKMTATQLFEKLFPVLCLQNQLGRVASEWMPELTLLALWMPTFVEAVANSAFRLTELKDEAYDEYSVWLPHINNQYTNQLIESKSAEISSKENGNDILEIMRACNNPAYYLTLPQLDTHENIKIVVDAICVTSQLAFNAVALSLNTEIWHAMSSIAQMYYTAELFGDVLFKVMQQPTYFVVPTMYFDHKANLISINEGTKSFFMSGRINNVFVGNVIHFNDLLKKVKPICLSTELDSLYPVESMELPNEIDKTIKVSRREDMAEMIAEYRTLKSELVDCLLLHEKENIQTVISRIQKTISRIASLVDHVHPGSDLPQQIQSGFVAFVQELPKVYTYKLSVMVLREKLDTLDIPIDKAIDDVSLHLYSTVEPAAVTELASAIEQSTFEPSERLEFTKSFSETMKPLLAQVKEADDLQTLSELLLLLQDNNIAEMNYVAESLPEDVSETVMAVISDSKYASYVKQIETYAELVLYDELLPVWYRNGVKEILESLKQQNSNDDAIAAMEILTKVETVETEFSLESDVFKCVEEANSKLTMKEMQDLYEVEQRAKKNIDELTSKLHSFNTTIGQSTDSKGCAILYKDSIRLIVRYFFNEYILQDWDPEEFNSLCQQAMVPLSKKYSADSIAAVLLQTRRKLRMIRLLKITARSQFLTECDRALSEVEESLRNYFTTTEKAHDLFIGHQKEAIRMVEEEFERLPNSNLRIFLSHLIHNVFLNLNTVDTFNANKFARDIKPIEKEFNLNKIRANQINATLNWIQSIDRDVLPVNYDYLTSILRKLLETLSTINDEYLFQYDQDVLMDIAIKLADAIGKLSNVRYSLILVRDMHKLYSVKEPLMTFVSTIVRTLEAYAEEIHTFPIKKHPILGLIESVPKMCEKLEILIEASFMLEMTKRHTEEAIQSINDFYEKCPEDIKENMQSAIKPPITAIESLNPQ